MASVITAAPTFFDTDERLDLPAYRKLLSWLGSRGVDGVLVAGTTGEFTALSDDERLALFRTALEVLDPSAVIAHIGAPSAHQAVRLARRARRAGVRRFAALTPYFHPAEPNGVLAYYQRICAALDGLPCYQYVYNELTACQVEPEMVGEVAALDGIVGAKISAQPASAIGRLRTLVPADHELLWGNDGELDQVVRLGGNGTVSGVSSVLPELFTAWRDALDSLVGQAYDQDRRCEALGATAREAVRAFSGGIGSLKFALARKGFGSPSTRVPTPHPSAARQAELRALLDRLAGNPLGPNGSSH